MGSNPHHEALAVRLSQTVWEARDRLVAFIRELTVRPNSRNQGSLVSLNIADYSLEFADESQRKTRNELARMMADLRDKLAPTFALISDGEREKVEEGLAEVMKLVNFDTERLYSLTSDREKNESWCRDCFLHIDAHVEYLKKHYPAGLVLVPDTNALVACPLPQDYRQLGLGDAFEFLVTPTVISELDALKMPSRPDSLRDKAKKALRILHGFGVQGDVLKGVVVDKSIRVRMIPTEPKFGSMPSWLEDSVMDDRLIASALAFAGENPMYTVVVVTSDLNLMNKARMAAINAAKPPKSED